MYFKQKRYIEVHKYEHKTKYQHLFHYVNLLNKLVDFKICRKCFDSVCTYMCNCV